MTSSGRIQAAAALAVVVAVIPAGAAQAADLPTNSRDGVTLKASKTIATFTFGSSAAKKLYRSIAGRIVNVSCTQVEGNLFGLSLGDDSESRLRAPKRGRTLRADARLRGADFCTVSSTDLRRKKGDKTTIVVGGPIVSVPLTEQGAVYVEERAVATNMVLASGAATGYAESHKARFPTFGQLSSVFAKAKLPYPLTALPNTSGTPPLGRVGYFSDGSTAITVAVARTGRRLYIEAAPDNRLSTNVANYLFADD